MEKVSVSLKKVSKKFAEKEKEFYAVKDFSFEFPPGKLTALLGPSGCGKTTTLRCIAGFYDPDEGEIYIGNSRMNGIPPYSRPTGTVFQNYALFPHMKVFDNIAYGLKIKKLPNNIISEKVRMGLELLQLEGMEDRYPHQLSGGQQQRVAIARVLVNEPQVLLFDEPLSNLDAKLRVYMRGEIKALQERLGITTIYVTHDQEEAMSISDIMIVMNRGLIEQVGVPLEIYRHPSTDFVAEFIGMTNYLEGYLAEVQEDCVIVSVGDYKLKICIKDEGKYSRWEEVKVVFRPEMVYFVDESSDGLSGIIKNISFLGSLARYRVEIKNEVEITLDDSNPAKILKKGDHVKIAIDPASAHIQKLTKI